MRLAVVLLLALPAVAAPPVSAQEGCILGNRGRNDTFIQTLPQIGRVTYIGGPHFVCDGGVQIFADSAIAYGERGMSHLIGSVRYTEAGRELRAAEARYFTNEGRLQAQGDVLVVDEEDGSSIRDGDLVYLLQTDFRETSEMTVTTGPDGVRPTAVLTPARDTTGARDASEPPTDPAGAEGPPASADPEPYRVVADRIHIRGSGYFTSSGDVVIERDSLLAYADSAEYDQEGEVLALVGGARVVGSSYELTGRRIDMMNPGGESSQVHALREARLTGEDVLLTAARIVVMLRDGSLDRLVATPIVPTGGAEADSVEAQRPEALVQDFVLTADSVELTAPGERLQRVFAAGSARSVSAARDSLNTEILPEVARKDWLEGDTVIIRFVGSDPVPPMTTPDTDTAGAVVAADTVGATPVADTVGAVVAADTGRILTAAEITDSSAVPDSAIAPSAVGDVVIAPDSGEEAEVEEIIARGAARSLYRIPPDDSTFRAGADAPAVHYVVGQEIRIRMEAGDVQGMAVSGQTRGVHLEPLRRDTLPDSAAISDSSAAVDTTGVSVDTLGAPTDAPERNHPSDPTSQDGPERSSQEHAWIRP